MSTTAGMRQLRLLLNERERSTWRGLLQTYSSIVRELDVQLRVRHDFALTSYEVLAQLYLTPERRLRLTDLADRLVFTRSGVTRVIDRLERQGYVARCGADDDGRGVFAVLTDSGVDRFDEVRHTFVAVLRERFFDRLREGELEQLDELWARLRTRPLPGQGAASPEA